MAHALTLGPTLCLGAEAVEQPQGGVGLLINNRVEGMQLWGVAVSATARKEQHRSHNYDSYQSFRNHRCKITKFSRHDQIKLSDFV